MYKVKSPATFTGTIFILWNKPSQRDNLNSASVCIFAGLSLAAYFCLHARGRPHVCQALSRPQHAFNKEKKSTCSAKGVCTVLVCCHDMIVWISCSTFRFRFFQFSPFLLHLNLNLFQSVKTRHLTRTIRTMLLIDILLLGLRTAIHPMYPREILLDVLVCDKIVFGLHCAWCTRQEAASIVSKICCTWFVNRLYVFVFCKSSVITDATSSTIAWDPLNVRVIG